MKKLNKLCAILFAVLGVTTLKAQTDVTSTYLTNAGFDDDSGWKTSNVGVTAGGNMQDIPGWTKKTVGWSSAATFGYGGGGQVNGSSVPSTGPDGTSNGGAFGFSGSWSADIVYTQAVTLPAGVYTLSFNVYNAQTSTNGNNKLQTNKFGFVTSSGTTYYATTTTFASSSWTEVSTTFALTAETSGNISIGAAFPEASSTVTPRLVVDGVTLTYKSFDEVTYENPADFTSLIVNPSFETGNSNGWTYKASSDTGVKPNSNGTYTTSGVDGNYLYNTWWQGTPLTQTVANLPNGIYELKVLLASDNGANLFLLANDGHSAVQTITGDKSVFQEASFEFKVLNGQATIGVVGGNDDGTYNADGYWWYKADNFRLTYKGIDLSIIKEAYETALANATAARDNVEYESVTGLERTNLLNAISLQPAENKSELEAATTALLNATTAFTASKPDYDALAAEKTIAAGLGMSEESIASAAATTKTGLVALQDLKVAEYNYIQGTYTENATLGSWTEDFAEDLSGEGYNTNGSKYFNEWGNATRTAKQTVKLPAGDYAISGIGRGQVGTSGYLYYKIGEETTQVDFIMKGNRGRGVDVNGVANFSEEGEYNCNGEGFGWEYRFITFHLDAETEVEIGVSATFANAWVSIYAPVLLTTESSVKVLRMTEIANLLSTVPTGKMNATVQSTLDEKKDAAEAASAEENTIDELSTIATELNEAIIAANTSIAEYEKIATYIAKANTIDESIAADVQTQYDNGTLDKAEPVFQALEVATYNYVTENFNYAVAISSTWNSTGTNTTAKEFNNEHWSGETRGYMNQNDDNGQGWNANSWSLDFDQTVTLPAGEYVFKVAGRKSVDATLQLVVTKGETTLGTVEDFPNGNATRGINKAGAASFDANDETGFANKGNGFGWQWRYVKFELAEESDVKIAVHAETSKKNNWVSFGDYTLQMTEETYLEANKGGLDAPTAAAEALVDSKPMGTAENYALKAALALPVTTGAELLAKIDALNAAVANANTWIANYNTAKAPLVAALERFETDYNDAENGALNHMNKDRWAYAVEMAQAAAVAKDVTDSYEGFATATENLVAALDAATVSVGEYTALKTAIDEATPYLGGNDWGSEPFQKPESAKDDFNAIKTTAQNAYDAAEVDGEGVTAVIESLNTAINDVVLNAPEEGQRFYIKVATEGHGKVGNAILATLGATSANNPTGYGLNANNELKPYLNQAFIFTQVEGNLYNISIERPEGTVYLTYGSLNESAAGWKNQQIQATTDAEKKGDFKIVPTGKNGILKIFNTVDNNYLDCQDGGSIYTDTNISKEEFAFELATEHSVALNVSSAGWATLILPFNAEIPEGVTVYGSEMIDGDLLKLSEAVSIVANTPYLVNGTEGTYNFSGYGLAEKDSYADANGFVGTYVDYATTVGDYVLQKQGNAVAFYIVGESAQPTVKPYRCYLNVPASEIKAFFIFDDGATGINGVDAADAEIEAIYTINGVKVNSLQKGLNIVKMSNGKTQKVLVP